MGGPAGGMASPAGPGTTAKPLQRPEPPGLLATPLTDPHDQHTTIYMEGSVFGGIQWAKFIYRVRLHHAHNSKNANNCHQKLLKTFTPHAANIRPRGRQSPRLLWKWDYCTAFGGQTV